MKSVQEVILLAKEMAFPIRMEKVLLFAKRLSARRAMDTLTDEVPGILIRHQRNHLLVENILNRVLLILSTMT